MSAANLVKIIFGLLLLLVGLWFLIPLGYPFSGVALDDFIAILIGVVPVALVIVGILIIWIESEEFKSDLSRKKK